MEINSTKSYSHKYELLIHRRNAAGRPLTSLTVMQSNDRGEVQAEHDRRSAQWGDANSSLRKRNRLEIAERTTHAEAEAARRQIPPQ